MRPGKDYSARRFQEEIESRRTDEVWDRMMATRVLAASRRRRNVGLSLSLSLAGASAAAVFIIFFQTGGVSNKSLYEPFVTRQVQETFKASGLSDSDVDSMIDETLAMR